MKKTSSSLDWWRLLQLLVQKAQKHECQVILHVNLSDSGKAGDLNSQTILDYFKKLIIIFKSPL